MQVFEDIWNNENLINVLKNNGVVVMPTDTLYGIVGRAYDLSVVERIYNIRKRASEKPCIILIGNITQVENFSVTLSEEQKNTVQKYWPGPISIILDCPDDSFSYLHRGTKTLAFRIPSIKSLRDLLLEVGPLIAPSANPEGLLPAEEISEAKDYFGDSVDLYMDGGKITGKASKVIKLHKGGSISILRE